MLNTVKNDLADVLSVSPSLEQKHGISSNSLALMTKVQPSKRHLSKSHSSRCLACPHCFTFITNLFEVMFHITYQTRGSVSFHVQTTKKRLETRGVVHSVRKLFKCMNLIYSIGDICIHSVSSFSKSLNTPLGSILIELFSRLLLRF